MTRRWTCWPRATSPFAALDQQLEDEYGDAFARLDVALLLGQPDRLQRLLAPFTVAR